MDVITRSGLRNEDRIMQRNGRGQPIVGLAQCLDTDVITLGNAIKRIFSLGLMHPPWTVTLRFHEPAVERWTGMSDSALTVTHGNLHVAQSLTLIVVTWWRIQWNTDGFVGRYQMTLIGGKLDHRFKAHVIGR